MAPFRRSDPCRNVTSQLILSDSGVAAATGCDRGEVVGTTSSASSVIGSSSLPDDINALKRLLAEQEALNRALLEKLNEREREIDHRNRLI